MNNCIIYLAFVYGKVNTFEDRLSRLRYNSGELLDFEQELRQTTGIGGRRSRRLDGDGGFQPQKLAIPDKIASLRAGVPERESSRSGRTTTRGEESHRRPTTRNAHSVPWSRKKFE